MSDSTSQPKDDPTDPERGSKRKRDLIDWFEIHSRFILALAGIVIAGAGVGVQKANRQRTEDERSKAQIDQIRTKYIAADAARQIVRAQAVAPLVRLALSGTTSQRKRALSVLAKIAPSVAMAVTEVLEKGASVASDKKQFDAVYDEASLSETTAIFQDHLEEGREFLGWRFYPEACAEFLKAQREAPNTYMFRQHIDEGREQAGERSCENPTGDRERGATEMLKAFEWFQTP
jgi:hypothetical protein